MDFKIDKEKRRKIQQDYRRRNCEILRKKAKQYRESKEGHEKRRKYQQEYGKKNREKMKEYERRRYMKKKDGRKVEEERPNLMNANQNLEETRILPNEIEPQSVASRKHVWTFSTINIQFLVF